METNDEGRREREKEENQKSPKKYMCSFEEIFDSLKGDGESENDQLRARSYFSQKIPLKNVKC